MAKYGPAPQPTVKLKSRGTFQPCRRPKKEPSPDQGKPKMPASMTPEAKKIWPRLVKGIDAAGTLFVSDAEMIAAACEAKAEYDQARKSVRDDGISIKGGNGFLTANPAVGMSNNAWKRYIEALREFGLSPSARTRVELAPKETKEPEDRVDRMFA